MATKTKKNRLVASAKASVREPLREQALEPVTQKKGYRVIAISVYSPEADWIDRTTTSLRQAGSPKANRSQVVREAVLRLQEELVAKTPAEILQDFTARQARRTNPSP